MIILAHIIMFLVLFGLAVPGLSSVFGAGIRFDGGILAVAALALSAEAVVLVAAVVARAIALSLNINPLLARGKAALIAQGAIFLALAGFLLAIAALFPAVITLTWYWALVLSGLTVGLLEVMVRIKRHLAIRSSR